MAHLLGIIMKKLLIAVALISGSVVADDDIKSFYTNIEYQKLELNNVTGQFKGLTMGYNFHETFAIQGTYMIAEENEVNLSVFNLDLVTNIKLNKLVSLHTEIGISSYEEDYVRYGYEDSALHASVGLQFQNEEVTFTISYQTYQLDDADMSATGIGATVGFKF